jgi:hypothetical protein
VEERGDDGVSEVWMSASDVSARWGRVGGGKGTYSHVLRGR